MKAMTKISLISGLLASSMVLADPKPDIYTDSRGCGQRGFQNDEGPGALPGSNGGSPQAYCRTTGVDQDGDGNIETANSGYKGKNVGESQGVTGTPADNEYR